jgi:hypothetical protein
MWALIAALNFVGLGIDVGNAFAEAPPLKTHSICKWTLNFKTGGHNALVNHLYQKDTSSLSSKISKDTPKVLDSGIHTSGSLSVTALALQPQHTNNAFTTSGQRRMDLSSSYGK